MLKFVVTLFFDLIAIIVGNSEVHNILSCAFERKVVSFCGYTKVNDKMLIFPLFLFSFNNLLNLLDAFVTFFNTNAKNFDILNVQVIKLLLLVFLLQIINHYFCWINFDTAKSSEAGDIKIELLLCFHS